jgi:sugar lactone lactonase YvrE
VLGIPGDQPSGLRSPDLLRQRGDGPAQLGPTVTFDPKGSQSVAIFDNQAHALSKLGHFPKENTVVMRGTGNSTIILTTEDGPRTPDSQLYLYVGRELRESDNVLSRNGLDNGKLYAFASDDSGFVRIEDGEFKPNEKSEFWFDTTGDQQLRDESDPTTNELGRLYRLRFDGRDPLKGATR